jgi:hypothetical protein
MELIDELMRILEANPDLGLRERAVLKTAISFLEQKEHRFWEDSHDWRVQLTWEEYRALPGGMWELCNGQPCPKE